MRMSSTAVAPARFRWWAVVAVWSIALLVPALAVPQTVAPLLPAPPGKQGDTPALVALGEKLFFDRGLSKDGTVACATCHRPEHAFADPRPVSRGVGGAAGTRNAPSLINRAYGRRFFWDGRADTLERQAAGPLTHPAEMGLQPAEAVAYVVRNADYLPLWRDAFGEPSRASFAQITRAIAAYERTLVAPSAFHRWLLRKEPLPEAAERGRVLFFGKARCNLCHSGLMLSTEEFLNVGAGKGAGESDGGRFEVTMRREDWRLFKVPSLMNVARTAPYMHDGSIPSLEEVIAFYDRGGDIAESKDYRVIPLHLDDREKADLLAFLRSLDTDPLPGRR
jgi:cytochrome c peroxidase